MVEQKLALLMYSNEPSARQALGMCGFLPQAKKGMGTRSTFCAHCKISVERLLEMKDLS